MNFFFTSQEVFICKSENKCGKLAQTSRQKFFTKVIKNKVKQGDKHITVCLKQGNCVTK